MQIIEQLGLALGLASMAGINLYLTVFLAGVLIRFDLIQLAGQYQTMDALSDPMVLSIAGGLFLIEFFADKIPWVDSAWDSVHTFIRPVGATLLAMQALGDMSPAMQVVAGLLAGGAALTTHTAKAGSRLLINHSPEPVSNIAMSLGEDVAVVGGSLLAMVFPVIAFFAVLVLMIVLWIVIPRLWKVIQKSLRFIKSCLAPDHAAQSR
jgi:hypothetical protein